MARIVIYVEGGVVQEVYSGNKKDQVVIIDTDVLRETGKSKEEISNIIDSETCGVYSVYR